MRLAIYVWQELPGLDVDCTDEPLTDAMIAAGEIKDPDGWRVGRLTEDFEARYVTPVTFVEGTLALVSPHELVLLELPDSHIGRG